MRADLFQLLDAVGRGETEFKARSDTLSDLKEFQRTLVGLRKLQKSGHLEILDLRENQSSQTGSRRYDAALVSLTEYGQRDLAVERERKAKREK